jgi:hypothetical protein
MVAWLAVQLLVIVKGIIAKYQSLIKESFSSSCDEIMAQHLNVAVLHEDIQCAFLWNNEMIHILYIEWLVYKLILWETEAT